MPDVCELRRNFSPEQLEKERKQREREEKRLSQPFTRGATLTLGEYNKLTPNGQQAAWANHNRSLQQRTVTPDNGGPSYTIYHRAEQTGFPSRRK